MIDVRIIKPLAIAIAGLALCTSNALADGRDNPRRSDHSFPARPTTAGNTYSRDSNNDRSARLPGMVRPPGIVHRPYHPHAGKGAYICGNHIILPHSP